MYIFGINTVGFVEDGAAHCRHLRDTEYNMQFPHNDNSILNDYQTIGTMKHHFVTGKPMIRIGDVPHVIKNIVTQLLNVLRDICIKVDNVWYSCCGTKVLYRDIIQKAENSNEGSLRFFSTLTERHFIKTKNQTMNVAKAVSLINHKVSYLTKFILFYFDTIDILTCNFNHKLINA